MSYWESKAEEFTENRRKGEVISADEVSSFLCFVAYAQRQAIAAEIEKLRDPYFLAGKSREEIIDRVLEIVRNTMPREDENDK